MASKFLYPVIIFFTVTFFTSDVSKLALVIDPLDASFWNRGLRFMVRHYNTFTDTLFFDSRGNIVAGKKYRRMFDDSRLITRSLEHSDVPVNEVIVYATDLAARKIAAKHYVLKHNEWEFAAVDTAQALKFNKLACNEDNMKRYAVTYQQAAGEAE